MIPSPNCEVHAAYNIHLTWYIFQDNMLLYYIWYNQQSKILNRKMMLLSLQEYIHWIQSNKNCRQISWYAQAGKICQQANVWGSYLLMLYGMDIKTLWKHKTCITKSLGKIHNATKICKQSLLLSKQYCQQF